jgi:spore coat polysaccharide biosynthesis protein SpsF (cytidylyltransferase family)
LNPFDFTFDRDHILPVKSGSCEIVYVRSAIDPLDEPSAKRLVEEAARVVAKDGALVMSSSKFTDQALAGLVSDNGMTVLSKDRARVISRFNHIPRIAIDAESRNFVFAVCKGKRREI